MNKITGLILVSIFAIVVVGCTGIATETSVPEKYFVTPALPVITPTMTLSSGLQTQQSNIHENWINSAHAQTDSVVNCDVCHQLQNGIAAKDIAWLNQTTNQYEVVADSNDLCTECHVDADTAETAHSDEACVDCHNPHSLTASCLGCHKQIKQAAVIAPSTPTDGHPNDTPFCEGSGCHSIATQAAQSPFSIHGVNHAKVACVACHDADGFHVGPSEDGSVWSLWHEVEVDGKKTLLPYQSHNLQFEVDCERCHFEGNSWGLRLLNGN
jgi:hypothetical protein